MTAQIPDLFEWKGQRLPVVQGLAPDTFSPGIESCAEEWSKESGLGFDINDVTDVGLREIYEKKEAKIRAAVEASNAGRRERGEPEVAYKPFAGFGMGNSTACQRNYLATWGICDGLLTLVKLEGYYRLKAGRPLPVTFTGRFSLGFGPQEMSFWAPAYRYHLFLDFVDGRFTGASQDGGPDML